MNNKTIINLELLLGFATMTFLSYKVTTHQNFDEQKPLAEFTKVDSINSEIIKWDLTDHKEKVFDYFYNNKDKLQSIKTYSDGSVWSEEGDSLANNIAEYRKLVREYEKSKSINSFRSYEKNLSNHKKKVFDYFETSKSMLSIVNIQSDGSVWSEEGDSLAASINDYREIIKEYNEYEKSLIKNKKN